MFRRINSKILFGIFIALLAIVIFIKLINSGKNVSTFKSELISIDTSIVNSITILPKADTEKEVKLYKENNTWLAESNGKRYNADRNIINGLLTELINIKPERMAATDESRWEEYEVTDSTGIRVTVKEANENITDILIGKFSYQQPANLNPYQRQQGKMTSYVRLYDEKEVYAVNGFLNMTFNRQVNAFRNKTLIRSDKNDWTRLFFTYPEDSSFAMTIQNGRWMIGGMLADSTEADKYFNSISNLFSSGFVDDIAITNNASHSLRIEGNNMPAPIEISAFPADTVNRYLILSSLNTGSKFSGAKQNLFEKIFISMDRFFISEMDTLH